MPTISSLVTSDCASRYLQQLCKHFARKVPVDYTSETGQITFPFGTCTLNADSALLTVVATGETNDMDRLEQVIGDHFARFAFRENITLTWQRSD